MIGYPQLDILQRELSSAGFPLLGKLTPSVSWYIRTDDKYTSPSSIEELRQHNQIRAQEVQRSTGRRSSRIHVR